MLNDIHKPADKRKHVNDKQYSRVNRCEKMQLIELETVGILYQTEVRRLGGGVDK